MLRRPKLMLLSAGWGFAEPVTMNNMHACCHYKTAYQYSEGFAHAPAPVSNGCRKSLRQVCKHEKQHIMMGFLDTSSWTSNACDARLPSIIFGWCPEGCGFAGCGLALALPAPGNTLQCVSTNAGCMTWCLGRCGGSKCMMHGLPLPVCCGGGCAAIQISGITAAGGSHC